MVKISRSNYEDPSQKKLIDYFTQVTRKLIECDDCKQKYEPGHRLAHKSQCTPLKRKNDRVVKEDSDDDVIYLGSSIGKSQWQSKKLNLFKKPPKKKVVKKKKWANVPEKSCRTPKNDSDHEKTIAQNENVNQPANNSQLVIPNDDALNPESTLQFLQNQSILSISDENSLDTVISYDNRNILSTYNSNLPESDHCNEEKAISQSSIQEVSLYNPENPVRPIRMDQEKIKIELSQIHTIGETLQNGFNNCEAMTSLRDCYVTVERSDLFTTTQTDLMEISKIDETSQNGLNYVLPIEKSQIVNETPPKIDFSGQKPKCGSLGKKSAEKSTLKQNTKSKRKILIGENSIDCCKQVPEIYCVRLFNQIVNRVIDNSQIGHYEMLFSDWDRSIIDIVNNQLSDHSKLIFVRLFLRQDKWLPKSSLQQYLKCDNDVNMSDAIDLIIAEMCGHVLLDTIDSCQDLRLLLNLMSTSDLKNFLSKNMISQQQQKSGTLRKDFLIDNLINDVSNQNVVFSQNRQNHLILQLQSKLQNHLKLNREVRRLFMTIFHLYSLDFMSAKNLRCKLNQNVHRNLASDLIFNLLQKERGEIVSANKRCFNINANMFKDRECLLNYIEANEIETQLIDWFEHKKFTLCIVKCLYLKSCLVTMLEDQDYIDHLSGLSASLRQFTTFYIYCRCLYNYGIESMQRVKNYRLAVDYLKFLLQIDLKTENISDQDDVIVEETNDGVKFPFLVILLVSKRGKYYERLVVNLNDHLKIPEQAFEAIEMAFLDREVCQEMRMSLKIKAVKIASKLRRKSQLKARKCKKTKLLSLINDENVNDWDDRLKMLDMDIGKRWFSSLTIEREILAKSLGGSKKTIFVRGDSFCVPVEQMAIDYYKETENFEFGFHDEGSSWRSLFGLFLYNHIYDTTIGDVWLSSQQSQPLDLNDSMSFLARDILADTPILKQITLLATMNHNELCDMLRKNYQENYGKQCIVQWDFFKSLQQIEELISSIGGQILASVFHYLACDYKNRKSGFPDLLLWCKTNRRIKVVEVKGPQDRLSAKQTMWLNKFAQLGIEAELCNVKGVKKRIYQ